MNIDWWTVITDWWHSRDWPATGTVVLAVITGIYVYLVRKSLDETKRMAEATQVMAASSVRPELAIDPLVPRGRVTASIINKGLGLALKVNVSVGDKAVCGMPDRIPTGSTTSTIRQIAEAWDNRSVVRLSCTDILGKPYNFWWVYDGHAWVPTSPEQLHP